MKHFKMILFLCGIIEVTALSCGKDRKQELNIQPCPENYVSIEKLSDATCFVLFDKQNNQYYLNKYVAGTIDEMISAYPCDLAVEFKTEYLKVTVSGDLYVNDDLPKPIIGGQKVYHLKITQITNNQ